MTDINKIIESNLGKRVVNDKKYPIRYVLVEVSEEDAEVLHDIPEIKILQEMTMTKEHHDDVGGPTLYIP